MRLERHISSIFYRLRSPLPLYNSWSSINLDIVVPQFRSFFSVRTKISDVLPERTMAGRGKLSVIINSDNGVRVSTAPFSGGCRTRLIMSVLVVQKVTNGPI